jgi:hypothetical protein
MQLENVRLRWDAQRTIKVVTIGSPSIVGIYSQLARGYCAPWSEDCKQKPITHKRGPHCPYRWRRRAEAVLSECDFAFAVCLWRAICERGVIVQIASSRAIGWTVQKTVGHVTNRCSCPLRSRLQQLIRFCQFKKVRLMRRGN